MSTTTHPAILELVEAIEFPEGTDTAFAEEFLTALVASMARVLTPEVEAQLAANGVAFEDAIMHLALRGAQAVQAQIKVGAL